MTAGQLVATLVAPASATLTDTQIADFKARIVKSGGKIDKQANIAAHAVDIFFTGTMAPVYDLPFDVLIQPAANRRKKILIADMESTIIEQEMLDELAAEIGVGAKVADITRRAMNGELDFAAALAERVSLLQGQPASLLDKVAERMTLMPGAQKLISTMKQSGGKCWLVSGGFDFFAKKIADHIGFDKYFANHLVVDSFKLTGQVTLPILDKDSKKALLEKACAEYGCTLADTITIGDGANDIPMLQAGQEGGGLAVAYRAKPRVREIIHNQINHSDLAALAYAQGYAS